MTLREPASDQDTLELPEDEITRSDTEWPIARQWEAGPSAELGPGTAHRPKRPRVRMSRVFPLLLVPLVAAGAAWLLLHDEPSTRASGPPDELRPAAATPAPQESTTAGRPAAETIRVPDTRGMTLTEARAAVADAGLEVRVRSAESNTPRGEVLDQAPEAGSDVSSGTFVALIVSSGSARISVPDVVDVPGGQAARALRQVGLRPVLQPVPSSARAGTVLAQSPGAGASVENGTAVELRIARPEPIEVPSLVGSTAGEAKGRLRELRLHWRVSEAASSEPDGTVLRQSPRPGSEVRAGGVVSLVVSSGPTLVAVPEVTGMDEASARRALVAAGLSVVVVDEPTADPALDGQVIDQAPGGGSRVDPDIAVTITVARLA